MPKQFCFDVRAWEYPTVVVVVVVVAVVVVVVVYVTFHAHTEPPQSRDISVLCLQGIGRQCPAKKSDRSFKTMHT